MPIKRRAMFDRFVQLQEAVRDALREADDLWVHSPRGSAEAVALSDVGIGLERAALAMAQITGSPVLSGSDFTETTKALTRTP